MKLKEITRGPGQSVEKIRYRIKLRKRRGRQDEAQGKAG